MANILLRSPRFETLSNASAAYGTLSLSIDGTLRYTLTKDSITNGATKTVTFDISELVRDYLSISFSGSYSVQSAAVTGTITIYNSGGSTLSSSAISHTAFY